MTGASNTLAVQADELPSTAEGVPTGSTPLSAQHLPVLDGLRGVAILLVMFHHQWIITGETALDRAVTRVANFGWCGVDLFFVLSGFLITGILLDTRQRRHYFRNFYARRVLRIFPLYYAVVAFSLLVLPHLPHPKADKFGQISGDQIWYWLYLSNFSIARAGAFRHGILDISWSLAIEEQFYLAWPLCVWFAGARRLGWLCGCLLACSIATRVGFVVAGANWLWPYMATPCRLDGLAVGALLALLVRNRAARLDRVSRVAWPIGCALGLILLIYEAIVGRPIWADTAMQCIGFTLLAVVFGSLLLKSIIASPDHLLRRALESGALRTAGKYSYALYLFHLPLRAVLRDTIFHDRPLPTVFGSQLPVQILFCAASTILALAAAWISWNLYEKRFLNLKRYFES